MSKDVLGVQKTATAAEAAQTMTSRNVSSVVVLDRDVAVGVLSERDFLDRVVAQQRDPRRTQIEEIMSFPVISVPSHSSVFGSARIMEAKGVRRLVVMKEGKLCGIVTQTDIFRETKRRLQKEEDEHFRLLEGSHNNIYTADLDGQMTYVNSVFLRLFEVSDASEFIGQDFLPERFWVNPEERTTLLAKLRDGNVEIAELVLKTSTGKRLDVTLFTVFTRNARGESNGIQGMLHDITEQKELVALR